MVAELRSTSRTIGFGSTRAPATRPNPGAAASTHHAPHISFRCRRPAAITLAGSLLVLALCASPRAHAAPAPVDLTDTAALAQMEQQALSAQPREQCFLYTVLVQSLTEIAGRQLSAGEEEQALATLKHLDVVVTRMHGGISSDAKRLKNAELLVEHSSRRLSDMMHAASTDGRTAIQSSLQRLNLLHTELLAQVFAK